jgi:hypothetical protein
MTFEQSINTIIIKTIDNIYIPFIMDVIKQSTTINNMLEFTDDNNYIPLLHEKCTNTVMMKIKEFLNHIYLNPNEDDLLIEYEKSYGNTPLSEWLEKYINNDINIEMLCDLIMVSDYLDIKNLNTLTCSEMAKRIKNTQSIRELFP